MDENYIFLNNYSDCKVATGLVDADGKQEEH